MARKLRRWGRPWGRFFSGGAAVGGSGIRWEEANVVCLGGGRWLVVVVVVAVAVVLEEEEANYGGNDSDGEDGDGDNNSNEFVRDGFVGRGRRAGKNEGGNVSRKSYEGGGRRWRRRWWRRRIERKEWVLSWRRNGG